MTQKPVLTSLPPSLFRFGGEQNERLNQERLTKHLWYHEQDIQPEHGWVSFSLKSAPQSSFITSCYLIKMTPDALVSAPITQ